MMGRSLIIVRWVPSTPLPTYMYLHTIASRSVYRSYTVRL
jgi:hypothetical protein